MLSSLISSSLLAKGTFIGWWFFISACLFNLYLYWLHGVYGHVFLDIFYLLSAFWGLYSWHQNKNFKKISIFSSIFSFVSWMFLYSFCFFILKNLSGANFYLDSFSTSLALTALMLSIQRYPQSWLFWIAHDLINIIITYKISLTFQCIKQIIYIFIGIKGFLNWQKKSLVTH